MLLEPGQKIVFIGDSITDCDRRGAAAPYGDGYVSMVRNLLLARYPAYKLTVVNRGIGGDTTRNLAARWERDVIAERPDWLSVMIGINDVWRAFGGNATEAVPLPEYTATLRALLVRTRAALRPRLILADPYMIEPDPAQPMRHQMDAYGAVVRQLAGEFGAVHVPTQAAFEAALAHTHPTDWAGDQIPSQRPRPRDHRPGLSARAEVRVVSAVTRLHHSGHREHRAYRKLCVLGVRCGAEIVRALLVTQRVNRVQPRRPAGRVDAEEEAHRHREADRQQRRAGRDHRREHAGQVDDLGDAATPSAMPSRPPPTLR